MSRRIPVRRYSIADTLHAIAREIARERPGGARLAAPDAVERLAAADGTPPLVRLRSSADANGLLRWARALENDDQTVTLIGGYLGMQAETTGRIPRGPRITVSVWIYRDLAFDEPLVSNVERVMSLDEFATLAALR